MMSNNDIAREIGIIAMELLRESFSKGIVSDGTKEAENAIAAAKVIVQNKIDIMKFSP